MVNFTYFGCKIKKLLVKYDCKKTSLALNKHFDKFLKGEIKMEDKTKVLIVDDNSEVRESLCAIVDEMPDACVAGTAANGICAVEMIEKLKPDVILLDIIMPQLDGFGVIEFLNEREIAANIIVVSALTQENFVMRALELGAKYYIAKPFAAENIKSRIRDIVAIGKGIMPVYRPVPMRIEAEVKSIDERISSVFITIGIPAHIKGYHFLREAVKMVVDNPDVINRITKELYPGIAKHFGTTPSKVERAIRHAIEVAWTRGRIENINNVFGYNVYNKNDKPTNGEFIALIADKLIIEKTA